MEDNILQEEDVLYTGAIFDDVAKGYEFYEDVLGAGEVFTEEEWKQGYDIETELGIKLTPNNQGRSSSCVGQAFSKYTAILNALETKSYKDVSAKGVYSQISIGKDQGARLSDGANLIVNWGAIYEDELSSYENGNPPSEEFMIDKSWKTEEFDKLAKILQAKKMYTLKGVGIDYFARAIKDGHGMVSGVMGTNNGTWYSTFPVPPTKGTSQSKQWGHALLFGKVRLKDGKKQVAVLNSWGENVGEKGWQWLGEEWFGDEGLWVFVPFVLIDKPNEDIMSFKKEKNSKDIYFINEKNKTKTMIVDMETLNIFGITFEEVDSLSEYVDKGTLVLVERKIN